MDSAYKNTIILDDDALTRLICLIKQYPAAGEGTGIILVPMADEETQEGDEYVAKYNRLQIQNAVKIEAGEPGYLKIIDKSITKGNSETTIKAGNVYTFDTGEGGIGTFEVNVNPDTSSAISYIVKINGFGDDGNLKILDETEAKRKIGTNASPATGKTNGIVADGTNGTDGTPTLEGSITTMGGISANKSIMGYKLYGAIFNDYAEYRTAESVKPGDCVVECGDGRLVKSTERLQAGANIVSDTFGFAIGETINAQTPIAVCGRVLAYPAEDKLIYTPGAAVCAAPGGKISLMSREEIRNWPDRIVGYVSEIPSYDYWGSDNIAVDGRIWIKVK